MPRYAVLITPEGEGLPVGIVIERDGHVHVEAIDEYSLPTRFDEEYRVFERDLTQIVYRAGDRAYFDQVLVELGRHVRIGKQGVVPDAGQGPVAELVQNEVLKPRLAAKRHYGARLLGSPIQPAYRKRGSQDRPFVHMTLISSDQLQLDDEFEAAEQGVHAAFRLAA